MHVPLLYRVSRTFLRVVAGIYFRKLERSGAECVPASGAVILAANHPQSITDALILGLCAGRMVHYLAHSGLFQNPVKRWFLRNCGVIPVHRREEVSSAADKNVEMFAACFDVMEGGGAIGIFPEGTSAAHRRVQKLKTGAARIALEGERLNGWELGTAIVPVGINFESRGRFRSRVLVMFGEPIAPAEYRDAYTADPIEAVHLLTTAIENGIRSLVVDVGHAAFDEFVADVERVYKGDLLAREGMEISGGSKFQKDQRVSREIPRALTHLFERRPDTVWRIRYTLRDYLRKLQRFRLDDAALRRETPTVMGAATRMTILGLLGLPVAAWGVFWNVVPYRLTGRIARRIASDATKIHFYQITVGAVVYLLYYVPLLYLAYRTLGAVGVIIFAVLLPVTGLYSRAYGRRMALRRQSTRLAYLQLTHGYQVRRLQQQRKTLIAEMDAALEQYLSLRKEDSA